MMFEREKKHFFIIKMFFIFNLLQVLATNVRLGQPCSLTSECNRGLICEYNRPLDRMKCLIRTNGTGCHSSKDCERGGSCYKGKCLKYGQCSRDLDCTLYPYGKCEFRNASIGQCVTSFGHKCSVYDGWPRPCVSGTKCPYAPFEGPSILYDEQKCLIPVGQRGCHSSKDCIHQANCVKKRNETFGICTEYGKVCDPKNPHSCSVGKCLPFTVFHACVLGTCLPFKKPTVYKCLVPYGSSGCRICIL